MFRCCHMLMHTTFGLWSGNQSLVFSYLSWFRLARISALPCMGGTETRETRRRSNAHSTHRQMESETNDHNIAFMCVNFRQIESKNESQRQARHIRRSRRFICTTHSRAIVHFNFSYFVSPLALSSCRSLRLRRRVVAPCICLYLSLTQSPFCVWIKSFKSAHNCF